MHAVVRSYSGTGAEELFDLLEAHKVEIESLLRSVTGLVSYTLVRTEGGGVTITVCRDKAGTDESIKLARNWVMTNASGLGAHPPSISEGPVVLHAT